jgi:FAD/FMN-containing dehydrogenase
MTHRFRFATLTAAVALCPTLAFASEPTAADIDAAMAVIEPACPGIVQSLTCGNGVCDVLLGESIDTCQTDCKPGLVESFYAQTTICDSVQQVFRPTIVEEVQDAVQQSVMDGRRVRVVGSLHSATDIVCGDGSTIVMQDFDQIIGLEQFEGETVVRAESGVTFGELNAWLAERGYSLDFAVTGFNGISLGGAVGTGIHGTTPSARDSFPGNVMSMTVVTADGAAQEYSAGQSDANVWRALRTNLGLLGVVTEMRVRVVPRFKLRVQTDYPPAAALFEPGGYDALMAGCEFGYLQYFPTIPTLVRVCGVESDDALTPGARSNLLSPNIPIELQTPFITALQGAACDPDGFGCLLQGFRFIQLLVQPPFGADGPNGEEINPADLVGWADQMVTGTFRAGQPKVESNEWEVTVPAKQADEALAATRDILEGTRSCLPLVGVFIRYGKAEATSFLSPNAALGQFDDGERVLHLAITTFRPLAFSDAREAAYDAPFVDLVDTLVTSYGGRLHWGKNRNETFAHAALDGAVDDRIAPFQAVLDQVDPYGVFGSEWAEAAGFSWPNGGQDFSEFYFPGSNECGCPLETNLVCDRRDEVTYANACRASCDGVRTRDQIPGGCYEYTFGGFRGLFGLRYKTATRIPNLLPTYTWLNL